MNVNFMNLITEARTLSLEIDSAEPVAKYWELGDRLERLIATGCVVTLSDDSEVTVKSVNAASKVTGISQSRCNRAVIVRRSFTTATAAVKGYKGADCVDFIEWTSMLSSALNGKERVRNDAKPTADKVRAKVKSELLDLGGKDRLNVLKALAEEFGYVLVKK